MPRKIADAARLREYCSFFHHRRPSRSTAQIPHSDTRSNWYQRSRSAISTHCFFSTHLNHSPVSPPTWSPLRHSSIKSTGGASDRQWVTVLSPPFTNGRLRSIWRTGSAEKAITPSVPQPNVWQTQIANEIGTKIAARKPVRPSRASLSHRAKASRASAIDRAKLTKPNMKGKQ